MDDQALRDCLKRLRLGKGSSFRKAVESISGGPGWPTANVLVSEEVLFLAQGEALPKSATDQKNVFHALGARVSDLNREARKQWCELPKHRVPALYAFRFKSSPGESRHVFFVFEPELAEHLLSLLTDPTDAMTRSQAMLDHVDAGRSIEGYYGCPVSELCRHGKTDGKEGRCEIPFGKGRLSREELLKGLVHRVTMRTEKSPGVSGPQFVGVWGLSGIGKTTLARRIKTVLCDFFGREDQVERGKANMGAGLLALCQQLSSDRSITERFQQRVYWITLGKAASGDVLKEKKTELFTWLEEPSRGQRETPGDPT